MEFKWTYTKDSLPEKFSDVYAIVKTEDGFETDVFGKRIPVKPRIMRFEKDVKHRIDWSSEYETYDAAFWDEDNPKCYNDSPHFSTGKYLPVDEVEKWVYVEDVMNFLLNMK